VNRSGLRLVSNERLAA